MRRIPFIMALFCFIVAQLDSPAGGQTEVAQGSFLDALITDDPNPSTGAGVSSVSEAVHSPAEEVSYGMEEEGRASTDAVAQPSPASSSSPDIAFDEAVVQETPDIPMFSHKDHIEDVGAECVQCHQTLFSELVRGYKVGPSMKEICSQCHNGTDAPAELLAGFSNEKKYIKPTMPLFSHTKHIQHTEECNACHKDIYKPLKKIKKVPPMKLCMECHNNRKADGSCTVCHEHPDRLRPRSHTARWVYRNGHGTDARYHRRECLDCHAERECNECHRGQSSFEVHRPGYEFSHGMDARTRTVNCGYCHDVENSCVQCHVRKR